MNKRGKFRQFKKERETAKPLLTDDLWLPIEPLLPAPQPKPKDRRPPIPEHRRRGDDQWPKRRNYTLLIRLALIATLFEAEASAVEDNVQDNTRAETIG